MASHSAELPSSPKVTHSNGSTNNTDADRIEGTNGDTALPGPAVAPPLSASWRDEPLSETERAKVTDVLQACRDLDLPQLRYLAASEGGLVEDEVRRTACMRSPAANELPTTADRIHEGPILLGSRQDQHEASVEWRKLQHHRDEGQVQLDVNRSFVYYPERTNFHRICDARIRVTLLICGR